MRAGPHPVLGLKGLVDRPVDYTALVEPIAGAQLREFKRATRSTEGAHSPDTSALLKSLAVFVVIASFGVTWAIGVYLGLVLDAARSGADPTTVLVVVVGSFGIVGGFAYLSVKSMLTVFGNGPWKALLRSERFAAANGLQFTALAAAPPYPGAIFDVGRARRVTNRLRSEGLAPFEFGSYEYLEGSGRGTTKHQWGFLVIGLERALPHMLLDSKANNKLLTDNLPIGFHKDQVLSLEGDFDRYFTLYCPRDYERDALYLFTPDLMALLIDNAAPFDVEIVDRWMLVYSTKPFEPEIATFRRLFAIVDTVGAKARSQTRRYADERTGDFESNSIAPAGLRLDRRKSIRAILAVATIAVAWAVMLASAALGLFS